MDLRTYLKKAGHGASRRMAQALGVHLSKPGVYQLNPQGRGPESEDLQKSVKLASKVIAVQVLLALIAMIFMALWMWKLVGNV